MLFDYVNQSDDAVSTDQQLRQFFTENYIKVRYIRFSVLDEEGNMLESEALDELKATADDVFMKVNGGELSFDDALAQYNDDEAMAAAPEGFTFGSQDASMPEYAADAFALSEGKVGGVYAYSDGYYILERQAPDISYFEARREQVESAAKDWAFNSYIAAAEEGLEVSESSICKKINFENLMDYVK